jgi:hypothetical protein
MTAEGHAHAGRVFGAGKQWPAECWGGAGFRSYTVSEAAREMPGRSLRWFVVPMPRRRLARMHRLTYWSSLGP